MVPRILKRMQGLQQNELSISDGWDTWVNTPSRDGCARFGLMFLRFIKRELSHVKTITINNDEMTNSNTVVSS